MENLIWKPVTLEQFAAQYSVSNYGKVMNSKTGKILKQYKNNMGYYIVDLYCSGVSKHLLVSRLVAMAFVLNPENKPNVDHIDTNQANNYFLNLRWCTQSLNLANPISRKRLNAALKVAKNTPLVKLRNRQAQLKCKGTLLARIKNKEVHRHQMKKYRCILTGVIYLGGHLALRELGLGKGYILKSAKARRTGKPIVKYRNGKQILHFLFVLEIADD